MAIHLQRLSLLVLSAKTVEVLKQQYLQFYSFNLILNKKPTLPVLCLLTICNASCYDLSDMDRDLSVPMILRLRKAVEPKTKKGTLSIFTTQPLLLIK